MTSKYQFFTIPSSNRQKFTFLDMASNTFLVEKEKLLSQGFEIEDDTIYAETPNEAVKHFKSNYVYALEEYNASTNIFYSLFHGLKWLKNKIISKTA